MLSDFLCCRERFRLKVIEGIRVADTFNHRIEYGQAWHTCEEALAKGPTLINGWCPAIEKALADYCRGLCKQYVTQQEQVQHWFNVCRVQFPIYVKYWAKHADVKDRTPLLQEQVFHVLYKLSSGRTVYLRGKWDSVDLIGKGKAAGIFLQENKSKGDIKEEQLKRQLGFDLQTGFYLVALIKHKWLADQLNEQPIAAPIKGIRYNVIRRPLSGGKGSIVRWKAKGATPEETPEHYYARLAEIIEEDPAYFFMRWRVEMTAGDLARFEREFLQPCMEQLCDWYEWIMAAPDDPFRQSEHGIHWRLPYGVYNALSDGGTTDLDELLNSGSEIGLTRGNPLFRELQ